MPTLGEYFRTDFRLLNSVTRGITLVRGSGGVALQNLGTEVHLANPYPTTVSNFDVKRVKVVGMPTATVRRQIEGLATGVWDPVSLSASIAISLPASAEPVLWAQVALDCAPGLVDATVGFVEEAVTIPGDLPIRSHEARFTGRVFLYVDQPLEPTDIALLVTEGRTRGLNVHVRDSRYAASRTDLERPLAFISYDSRDKESYAVKLALGLRGRGCTVWFDDFSLSIGSSLRQSIELGLKTSRRCVLVLTSRYLENRSWASVEFDSVFTRERVENKHVFLPIWCGVDQRAVYDYCPVLADRYAAKWTDPNDLPSIVDRLAGILFSELLPAP